MTKSVLTFKRIVIALVAAAVCCWAIWQSARTGWARTLTRYATVTNQTGAADRAVTLSPADAETHYARGVVLQQTEDSSQAPDEFERAVQLRPRDYYLWLLLGVARDQNHDQQGALRALRQSVALAPTYAQPRWQLGNLLLRMSQVDQAFVEMRQAASSNPVFLPNMIDLAWGIYRGDVRAVVAAVQPQTDNARLEVALFFARHQQSGAALEQFLSAGAPSESKVRSLLEELLKAKAFSDAYKIWTRMHGLSAGNAIGVIRDPGFESSLTVGDSGFGWQIAPNIPNVIMSVDTAEHHSGAKSLRLEFRGNSNPTTPLLTQLVLVKPQTHYRVVFAAMTRELVSVALPLIRIGDASDSRNALLAQSPELRTDPSGWREFALEVTTGPETQAIVISVVRQNFADDQYPAFGTLWLDSFSIERQ